MKKKNLLLLVYESDVLHILEIARVFSKKYNLYFLSCDLMSSNSNNNINLDEIKNSGIKCKILGDFRDEILKINLLKRYKNFSIDWNFLKKVEENFINKNITNLIFRDFSFNEVDHHRDDYYRPKNKLLKIKLIELLSKKIIKLLNIQFDLIYSGGQSNFVRNFIFEYSKFKKIKFIFPQRRIFNLTYMEDSTLKYLDRYKPKNKIKYEKHEKEILKKLKNYKKIKRSEIKSYNENDKDVNFLKEIYLIILGLFKIVNYLRDHFKNRIYLFSNNLFFEKNTFFITYLKLRNAYRRKIITKIIKNQIGLARNEIQRKKYIYFPLHTIPEDGIFNSDEYQSQYNCIRQIIKYLPIDYSIIVKPHPNDFIELNSIEKPSFYSKILKLDNVFLVDYQFDHFELIKNTTAVITYNGSSALEANLLNKPSIVMSDTNYSNLKGMFNFSEKNFKIILQNKNKTKNYFKNNIKYFSFLSKYGIKYDIIDILYPKNNFQKTEEYRNLITKLIRRYI